MNNLKKLFSFSSTERYGIAILSFGVVALILFNSFQPEYSVEDKLPDFSAIDSESNSFYESKDTNYIKRKSKQYYEASRTRKKTASSNQYNSYQKQKAKIVVDSFTIEINSATVEEFQKIRGIGVKLSERIIKFRNSVGGFYSINQLTDVYGVKQEVIAENMHHFKINKSGFLKKSINQSEFKELLKHPYLDYDAVKCIFRFRNKSDSVSVNQAISCVADSLKQKVRPYLKR